VGRLDEVDLSLKLGREEYEERLAAGQERLNALRLQLGGLIGDPPSGGQARGVGPPLLVMFEGWDASGKGGAIKRMVQPLDNRHVRVATFAAPTDDEKRHHFMWRFFPKLPGWGGVAVFDRTWYGRVLVERVEGYATPEQWGRAYAEIVGTERSLAAEGMIIVKFWMHISEEEQLERFESRQNDPLKAWKLTDEDWINRAKRPQYEEAVEDMLERTDHEDGPWHLVPGDSKKYARIFVLETVIAAIETGLTKRGFEPIDVAELAKA
jgi:AMP-polyphosphate phosphotransferase